MGWKEQQEKWQALNDKIAALDADSDEKIIPYMGFGWRDVDFDRPTLSVQEAGSPVLSVYRINGQVANYGQTSRDVVAFDEAGKWDYPRWTVTDPDDAARLREAVENAVEVRTEAAFGAVKDVLMSLWVKRKEETRV